MEDIPNIQVVVNDLDIGMEVESNERRDLKIYSYMIETIIFIWEELWSFKDDNEKLVKSQEVQPELNATFLQKLTQNKKQPGYTSCNSSKGPLKNKSHRDRNLSFVDGTYTSSVSLNEDITTSKNVLSDSYKVSS